MSMSPAEYNAWYETARGRWIGEQEYRIQQRLLSPPSVIFSIDLHLRSLSKSKSDYFFRVLSLL